MFFGLPGSPAHFRLDQCYLGARYALVKSSPVCENFVVIAGLDLDIPAPAVRSRAWQAQC
jgi:hypothetical protein